jgi:AcrR family transcriptional regulator
MRAVSAAPHPFLQNVTAESIVDAALSIAGAGPVADLTMEQVQLESGASTSSMYHYFGNRQGLLAAVEKERYRRLALAEDRGRLEVGADSQSAEEFLQFIADELVRIATDPDAVEVREQRLRVASAALDDDDVFERMSIIQAEMFRVIGELVADGQRRGLVNPAIDPVAYCAWFHGMTLGRTVTERTFTNVDAWLAVAIPAALAPLRLPAE